MPGISRQSGRSEPKPVPRPPWHHVRDIVLVIALLTGGWPLLDAVLPETEPLPAGHRLVLEPAARADDGRSPHAVLTVPDEGWTLSHTAPTSGTRYQLNRGDLRLTARYVPLEGQEEADDLWSGLRRVARVSDAGATLSDPEPVRTERDVEGQTGTLQQDGCRGSVTALYAEDRTAALAVTVLSCATDPDTDLREARRVVEDVWFTPPREDGA